MLHRRDFVKSIAGAGLASATVGLAGISTAHASAETDADRESSSADGSLKVAEFRLKYAPHFGMFKHHAGNDRVDQIKFAADEGFTAWEDNGMAGRSPAEQERIAKAMADLGMTMGVFVASAHWGEQTFVKNDAAVRDKLIANMNKAVEVAKRVNAVWCTVLLDSINPRADWGYQTANAIENLKHCADVCEPAGLVMVLEPLNPRDHPGLFLTKIAQGYAICRAVGSPSCKILDDLYHQQISEGNLIPNIDNAWDEIAYFQIGDNPGRNEPTTGEVNYQNVFKHIHGKGFDGILGMEHGLSTSGKEGERALIDAYAYCDSFS